MTRTRLATAAVAAAAVWSGSAIAQRREGTATGRQLELTVKDPLRFGDSVLSPGRYRVAVTSSGLAFTDPQTMVTVATLPAQEQTSEQVVTPATIELKESGKGVVVVVRYMQQVYTARGAKTKLTVRAQPKIQLAAKHEAVLQGGIPEAKSELALVQQALKRYVKSVKHCADKAHRSRWRTDDDRFYRCICPLAGKWRLPKVSAPLRVHSPLAKGRSGFSLTVMSTGKAADCRVWVGPKPPTDAREVELAKTLAEAGSRAPP